MTLDEFSTIFSLLAVQLRATDADEATIRGYYAALKDCEPELVALAATVMAKRGGGSGEDRHWFPKTSEWRTAILRVTLERREALDARIRELHLVGHELCAVCGDTGWEPNPGMGRVARCACWSQRQLEIIGRRPWPQLPEHAETP